MTTPASSAALRKLTLVFGEQESQILIADTLAEIGLAALESPDDRLRFANALIKKGGIKNAIGRSIKIQAIMQGATE